MKPAAKERSRVTTEKHIKVLDLSEKDHDDSPDMQHDSSDKKYDVVLIGTSMFERFTYEEAALKAFTDAGLDKFKIFNCGVGGDRLCNILYRLDTLKVLDHFKSPPKLVILEGGANDVDRKNMNIPEFIDGMKQLINIVRARWPETKIVVLGVYPRKSPNVEAGNMLARIKNISDQLADLCLSFGPGVFFRDWSQDVLSSDGSCQKIINTDDFVDDVHFSKSGYDKFARRIHQLI